jgi:1,4-dihydroxy-2-naphthoyl-CoA hydrolase
MASYEALIGLTVDAATPQEARGRLPAVNAVKQPAGLVHGGIYPSMAESLATRAMEDAVAPSVAVGHSSQTSFLRPVLEGTVHASGRPRHRGRSTWVWEFDVTDDQGRLCALVRMTMAVAAR